MIILQLTLFLIIAVFLVVFTYQNPNPVHMQFMAFKAKSFPLISLILGSALGGMIITGILGLKFNLQLKKKIREMELDNIKIGGKKKI